MPSRKLFSLRRRGVQSPPLPSNYFSSNGSSLTITQSTPPDPPTVPQAVYPDYLNETAAPGWDVAVAVASILKETHLKPCAMEQKTAGI
ncbi:hypothetical protein BS47DRAFT_1354823 [Hydnum rufescens UP504]|uniref:Uncharacterized protein n=1 Tax=Hydnum rufescens UP504 TaxID=1448309 RepID=A0A9P6AGD3_9AGAM|nr:hypothetical protein BS47DRAFT_1354823 [Hydnum rufescens UP504]